MNDNLFEGVEIRRGALLAGADDVVTIAIAAGRSAAEALAFVSAVPGPWRVLEAEILSQVLRCEMGTQRFAAVFLASALEWSGVDPVAARAAYRLAELGPSGDHSRTPQVALFLAARHDTDAAGLHRLRFLAVIADAATEPLGSFRAWEGHGRAPAAPVALPSPELLPPWVETDVRRVATGPFLAGVRDAVPWRDGWLLASPGRLVRVDRDGGWLADLFVDPAKRPKAVEGRSLAVADDESVFFATPTGVLRWHADAVSGVGSPERFELVPSCVGSGSGGVAVGGKKFVARWQDGGWETQAVSGTVAEVHPCAEATWLRMGATVAARLPGGTERVFLKAFQRPTALGPLGARCLVFHEASPSVVDTSGAVHPTELLLRRVPDRPPCALLGAERVDGELWFTSSVGAYLTPLTGAQIVCHRDGLPLERFALSVGRGAFTGLRARPDGDLLVLSAGGADLVRRSAVTAARAAPPLELPGAWRMAPRPVSFPLP